MDKERDIFPFEEDDWEDVDMNKYDNLDDPHPPGTINVNGRRVRYEDYLNQNLNRKSIPIKLIILFCLFVLYMVGIFVFTNNYFYIIFWSLYLVYWWSDSLFGKNRFGNWLNKKVL